MSERLEKLLAALLFSLFVASCSVEDVVDTTAPVISLLGDSPVQVEVGSVYNDAGAFAQDNVDGIISSRISVSSTVNTGVVGSYTVTYEVSDKAGNAANPVVRIVNVVSTVVDTTAPVISLLGASPVQINVGSVYNDAGATALDDVDGDISASISVTSTVDPDTLGSYTVTYEVSDAAGNAATPVVRTVNVVPVGVDTTEPVISLLGSSPVQIEVGSTYNDAGATATDNVDGNLTASISATSTVNTGAVGSYTVTYEVSDAAGNAATPVVRTVNVVDTTAPVISLLGSSPVQIEVGSTYNDAGATATDNVDGNLTASISATSTVNTGAVGSYTVTYEVSDTAGNAATPVVRTVNVVDTTAPVISLLGSSPVQIEVGSTYNDAGATATDNVDGNISASISATSTVNTGAVGSYTVTYEVSDTAGNDATPVVRTVNVVNPGVDVTPPTVISTSPADSATSVALGAVITATFDEDVFASTVDTNSFTLAASGNISGTVSFNSSTNVASFTPDAALAQATTYTATLSTAITDLSGNALASDYSWSFTTTDGGAWGTAGLVEDDESGEVASAEIAVDGNGNAIAVWGQYDSSVPGDNIMANYFDGSNWGAAELVETTGGTAVNVQVAMDGSGHAVAVWQQNDSGGDFNIWANHFDGSNWGTAQLLETDDVSYAEYPAVAMDGSGNALAVWHQTTDGMYLNIFASYFDGSSWSAPEAIEANTEQDRYPQVAIDGSANAIVVWNQFDGSRIGVVASRFNGSNWSTPESIESISTGEVQARTVQLALNSSGNAVAAWRHKEGVLDSNWANIFDGSSWGTAELLETSDAGNAADPQVAIDGTGRAIVVWHQDDGSRNNIRWNRFDGSNWGSDTLLESDNDGEAEDPQIAMDGSGNAMAVWRQNDGIGTYYDILSRRFDGSNWGATELVENNAGHAKNPQIAVGSDGSAFALWLQIDSFWDSVWANQYQ